MSITTLSQALSAAAEAPTGSAEQARGFRFLDRRERETALSFDALLEQSLRVAGALDARGIPPGERVALVLPTSPDFLAAFFGCHLAGAVPCPVYPPMRLGGHEAWVDRTSVMLERAGAVALIGDTRSRPLLDEVTARMHARCGVLRIADLLQAPRPTHAPHTPTPDDLALVQFSSGTTRVPAAVALTHRQVLANLDAIHRALPHDYVERGAVCWLPLYHDMGLVGCVLSTVYAANQLALIDPLEFLARPALWLRALSRYRAAASPAPDFAYARCVDRISESDLDGVDLSGWVAALNGAEPIAARTMRRFAARFTRYGLRPHALTPVYGLAEATLAVCFSSFDNTFRAATFERDALGRGLARRSSDALAVELVSVGTPLEGFAVRIADRDGRLLEDGAVGRIHVRGPSVTSGYLGGDHAPLTADGWLDTGDLGFLDDGELFVCGRARDIVILRGRNHAPHDIERAVDEVAGVRPGCAVAVGEIGSDGERLLVFVECREPRTGLAEACRKAIKRATGLDPARVVLLEGGALPRTSSGKLRRSETLARWRRGELVECAGAAREARAARTALRESL